MIPSRTTWLGTRARGRFPIPWGLVTFIIRLKCHLCIYKASLPQEKEENLVVVKLSFRTWHSYPTGNSSFFFTEIQLGQEKVGENNDELPEPAWTFVSFWKFSIPKLLKDILLMAPWSSHRKREENLLWGPLLSGNVFKIHIGYFIFHHPLRMARYSSIFQRPTWFDLLKEMKGKVISLLNSTC